MSRRASAFTIVELLLTLGAVVVLTSIVLASLRGVLGSSKMLLDLQNLSRSMQDLASWSAEHDGQMLNAGLPGDPSAEWFYGEPQLAASTYLSHVDTWPQILSKWSGQRSPHWQSTVGPNTLNGQINLARYEGASEYYILPTQYLYSATMITSADLWKYPGYGFESYDQIQPFYKLVSADQIRAPSAKGVLVHWARPTSPRVWDIAFADGSVRHARRAELREPGAWVFGDPMTRYAPVLSTIEGYMGVDE